jgi:hypothetical protein
MNRKISDFLIESVICDNPTVCKSSNYGLTIKYRSENDGKPSKSKEERK